MQNALDQSALAGSLEPVALTGSIAAICEQPIDIRQTAQQRPCAGIIADLPGGEEEVDRAPLTVADGVQFGVHATFGSTDQASTPVRRENDPPDRFLILRTFAAMLVAVRCAFR